ncbi:deoxyhypusine synthase [Candidatus Bathyarchaeota archaeon]|nr:deoxyhypusine synthase [Candidatus Bathyarchaeota archaeon]
MRNVKQIEVRKGITVSELVKEMEACGVLGAGRIGKAARLLREIFTDSDYTVFLTLAGALVPGGMRNIISHLIDRGFVDVIVTTGANMVHDVVEALGYRHKIGTFKADDAQLRRQDIGRIGDIYVEHRIFRDLERWLYKILDGMRAKTLWRISPSRLLKEIGDRIEDKNSILATSARKNIPVICPGLPDSILGFQLWTYGQGKKLVLDPLGDVSTLVDIVYEAEKSGMVILGGGLPKHFGLFANTFRGGVDVAIQITMDRAEHGGLSGAPLEESVSWGKAKSEERTVSVVCDATIAFPLIVSAALD